MKKILSIIALVLFVASSYTSRAQSTENETETVASDSLVSVIGWFSERDTLEYKIVKTEWKISDNDTLRAVSANMNVRIVVTDSTANGFKMEYTFLNLEGDSTITDPLGQLKNRITEKLGKKLAGTKVHFKTDEYGEITEITNLDAVRKKAKSLFNDGIKELSALPGVKELKKMGIDFKEMYKNIDTDVLVNDYLAELSLVFACHGRAYRLGETNTYTEASENSYEGETATLATNDPEKGTYNICYRTYSVIPASATKEAVKNLTKNVGDKSVYGNVGTMVESVAPDEIIVENYLDISYFQDGWPYELLKQVKTSIENKAKVKQTYMYATKVSTQNW